MAFNASSINTRYTGSNKIKVLKDDMKKIAADLIILQTFAATASSNAGTWSKLQMAEITVTPATNIDFSHINTAGYASTTDLGKWKNWLLGAEQPIPATNIQLLSINTNGYASSNSLGKWIKLLLDKTASLPGSTNVAVADLKQTSGTIVVNSSQEFPSAWNCIGTVGQAGTNAIPFFQTSSSIGTDSGSETFFWTAMSCSMDNLSSSITMGAICKIGCVQVAGVRVFMPIFIYFGINLSGTRVFFFTNSRTYRVDEF